MPRELHPTKHELVELGKDIMEALRPLREKHSDLVVAIAFGLPREGSPEKLGTCTATNAPNPHDSFALFVNAAREIKVQMIDPFYVETAPLKPTGDA